MSTRRWALGGRGRVDAFGQAHDPLADPTSRARLHADHRRVRQNVPRALVAPITSITYAFGSTKEFAEVAAGVLTPRSRTKPAKNSINGTPQRASEPIDVVECWIALAALDAADVGQMQTGPFGKSFLR